MAAHWTELAIALWKWEVDKVSELLPSSDLTKLDGVIVAAELWNHAPVVELKEAVRTRDKVLFEKILHREAGVSPAATAGPSSGGASASTSNASTSGAKNAAQQPQQAGPPAKQQKDAAAKAPQEKQQLPSQDDAAARTKPVPYKGKGKAVEDQAGSSSQAQVGIFFIDYFFCRIIRIEVNEREDGD
jgi:hypothetical protein